MLFYKLVLGFQAKPKSHEAKWSRKINGPYCTTYLSPFTLLRLIWWHFLRLETIVKEGKLGLWKLSIPKSAELQLNLLQVSDTALKKINEYFSVSLLLSLRSQFHCNEAIYTQLKTRTKFLKIADKIICKHL